MVRATVLLPLFGVCCASAYQDTSPFFYFSTSDTLGPPETIPDIIRPEALFEQLKPRLAQCSSNYYVILRQPGWSPTTAPESMFDMLKLSYDQPAGSSSNRPSLKTSFSVSNVIDRLDAGELEEYLQRECGAEIYTGDLDGTGLPRTVSSTKPQIIRGGYEDGPEGIDSQNNYAFSPTISAIIGRSNSTIMHVTTPWSFDSSKEEEEGHPSSPSKGHHNEQANGIIASELRRRSASPKPKPKNANADDDDDSNDEPEIHLVDGPLFHRYQFFTPGIFMGLLVSFLLLGILSVGVTALGSLQVSYGAFEKEMGPSGYKKGQ
ncbi:MAG: protein-ER retention protein [Watsoniomyces obsoletus]|nr:MAG: protein-ER retention protein [Watsoniomyces obsoletus]